MVVQDLKECELRFCISYAIHMYHGFAFYSFKKQRKKQKDKKEKEKRRSE